jgi:hypothetical protein
MTMGEVCNRGGTCYMYPASMATALPTAGQSTDDRGEPFDTAEMNMPY